MRAHPKNEQEFVCEAHRLLSAETPGAAGLAFYDWLKDTDELGMAIVANTEHDERWTVDLKTGEANLMHPLPADPKIVTLMLQLKNLRDAAVKFTTALEEEFPDENVSIRVPEMIEMLALVVEYDHGRHKERVARKERANARAT